MIALAVRYWYVLAITGLVALLGLQQLRVDHAQKETAEAESALANDRATYAQAAQAAEQTERAKETRREAEKQEVIDAAKKRTEAAVAAARTSDAAAIRLRNQLAAYVTAASQGSPNPAAGIGSSAATGSVDLLADLYIKADQRAGELSVYADAARRAGQACEASYDSLSTTPKEP